METKISQLNVPSSHIGCNQLIDGAIGGEDRDYYNDMPGKVPPDFPEKGNVIISFVTPELVCSLAFHLKFLSFYRITKKLKTLLERAIRKRFQDYQ